MFNLFDIGSICLNNTGKALQWNINDCHGDHDQYHFHAHLSKIFNIPPRGSCLTIEYSHHTRSSCTLDVQLDDAKPNWYGRRWKPAKNKIYFSKSKNGKRTAYVTLPPSRGGCAPKKVCIAKIITMHDDSVLRKLTREAPAD